MNARWVPPREVGEYQMVRMLGHGAMGEVWLGHDTLLDRPVAIKFIMSARIDDVARARFFTEARAIARLDHPNVIRIHRVGETDRRPFLVAEYLRGQSLDCVTRPIPIRDAYDVALGLARGLAAAHRRGVLHRDVKPANAFRTEDGQVKLLDFGLAKVIEIGELERAAPLAVTQPGGGAAATLAGSVDARSQAHDETVPGASAIPPPVDPDATMPGPSAATPPGHSPTLVGAVMGTPSYLAPELWAGDAATMESDVYALGATLYELLAGTPPHVGGNMTLLVWMACSTDAKPLASVRPEVPAALARVIDRCLHRDPATRYTSAEVVATELEAIARDASADELPEGNPYRGLSSFDEHHRRMFFGRDREIAELIDRLRSEPWQVIAGRSGAGKSSVVRAGVVPRVRANALDERPGREPWQVMTIVPGERPMAALATAAASTLGYDEARVVAMLDEDPGSLARTLRSDRKRGTLLVIDQLEELVTISNADERERFIEALAPTMVLTPNVRVVATIRSDFVGHFDDVPQLARTVGRALYLLGPLDRDGLRAAVTAPVAAYGFRFEAESDVEALTGVVAPNSAGLPLLEFALARLWELRDVERHVIPSRALRDIGGVEGALTQHADDVIAVLSPATRTAVRRVLVRMVSADRTRAHRTAAELCRGEPSDAADATRAALDALVQGRLLAVDEDSYQLAHEALLTHWTRLRVWLDEADVDHATRERIELAAADWDRHGRPSDGLWRGQQIAAVATLPLDELGATAREFVDRGLRARRRGQLRRRGAVIASFVILASWGTFALWLNNRANEARDRASEERDRAEISARAANAQTAALYKEQGRQALIAGDPMRAVAYLAEAYDTGQRGAELEFLVERASGALDGDLARMVGHIERLIDMSWSPDGTRIVTTSVDQTARIWRVADGAQLTTLRGHRNEVLEARFSPDGKRIATASFDNTAAIWNAGSGERLHVLAGHTHKVFTIEWSPDGHRLVTSSADKTARVWDADTGALLGTLRHNDRIAFARFSPIGDRILTGGTDQLAFLWDPQTFKMVARLDGHRSVVWRGAFSPDGRYAATGSDDRTARVWNAATGAFVATFSEHTRKISHIVFSPDGQLVATSSEDGTARVWRPTTGETVATFVHGAPVWYVAFSPDGRRIATSCGDGTAALWQISDATRLWTFVGHTNMVMRSTFSPDGKRVATVSEDRTARIWDASRSVVRASFEGQRGAIWDARFSPDGTRVATAADDRTVWIWDSEGHALKHWDHERATERLEVGRFVRWNGDGTWFAMGRDNAVELRDARSTDLIRSFPTPNRSRLAIPDGTGRRLAFTDESDVKIADVTSGAPISILRGHTAPVNTVDWSRDGRVLLSASEDKTARLWDVAEARELARLDHDTPVTGGWFSPTGNRFVTAGHERTLVWDSATRRVTASLDEETSGVIDAAWSPDGELIGTGSVDGAVRVWAAATGRLLAVVGRHRDAVVAVAFHPDGRRLLSSSVDGGAKLWTLVTSDRNLERLVRDVRCRVPYHIERGLLARRSGPCLQ